MLKNDAPKPWCVFLMGPTASGKTQLALDLADRVPIDLISVDSAMIYRDMNIGTAKPDADTLQRYPHGLVDVRDPHQAYSVADFLVDARALALASVSRGRLPILVGGTMLYFRTALDGLSAMPASSPSIRATIEIEAQQRGWPAMHAELAQIDPVAAARLHPAHSQRIARALEVFRISGQPLSMLQAQPPTGKHRSFRDDFQLVQMVLDLSDRSVLHDRIGARFSAMLDQGLVEEVRQLREDYPLSADMPSMRSVGYRQVWQYQDGLFGKEEMVARATAATRQLAKRQLTWLRGWPGAHRLDAGSGNSAGTSNRELTEAALLMLPRELF